jgi:hypothetical protein
MIIDVLPTQKQVREIRVSQHTSIFTAGDRNTTSIYLGPMLDFIGTATLFEKHGDDQYFSLQVWIMALRGE